MIFHFHSLDITTQKSIEMIEIARRLRKDSTRSEELLWYHLRNRQFDSLKVRRQHPIGPFVVDFYIHERRLAIEVDGSIHEQQEEYDAYRQQMMESVGVQFYRVTAEDVEVSPVDVLARLKHWLG